MQKTSSDLRIAALLPQSTFGRLFRFVTPILDKLLGISRLRCLYHEHQFAGLAPQQFTQKLLDVLTVKVVGGDQLLAKIPDKGRFIVVCNHPYGMIEGVVIAHLLSSKRSDTKIMANVGLQLFQEIADYFIFANPLKTNSAINTLAIKQSFQHLQNDGVLVLFPAGRVSFYHADKQRIADGEWNRLAIQLAAKTNSPILPVFISGNNSRLFYLLGRIYYRFRLLMLIRELLKLQQHEIALSASKAFTINQFSAFTEVTELNDIARLQCYLNDPQYLSRWPADNVLTIMQPIISATNGALISDEIAQLPASQQLLEYKNFTVCCGFQAQLPNSVCEITRLREITFRSHNESSGNACDTDKFDATYMHLFIFDRQAQEIIGAYRIGLTDQLLQTQDVSTLYLSQMFTFSSEFINQQQPCLEMGRSFIVEKHQNSFYGLLLLWKGIGTFVSRNPQYRTLYGTVSLSKLYDPRSVAMIDEVMTSDSRGVTAKHPFSAVLHPEFSEYNQRKPLSIKQLSTLVQTIEADGKDIPILLKQYHKLGAVFHCTGIDDSFNQTPGLLLSVNLANAPRKLLNLYLGDAVEQYLAFDHN